MIVFDTNVLSEPLRAHADARVLAWMRAQSDVAISAISIAELHEGARRLPEGRRRSTLIASIDGILTAGTVLPFAADEARVYGAMHELRRAAGRPLAALDGMIAATAATRGAALATRNLDDFTGLGLALVNPWA